MQGKGRRGKGHSGERELCKLLTKELGLKKPLDRNIDQVREGGADIISLPPFAIEVKRQETINLTSWLNQASSQVTKRNPIPILAYRRNREPWKFMIPWAVISKKKYRSSARHWVSFNLKLFKVIAKSLI